LTAAFSRPLLVLIMALAFTQLGSPRRSRLTRLIPVATSLLCRASLGPRGDAYDGVLGRFVEWLASGDQRRGILPLDEEPALVTRPRSLIVPIFMPA